MIGTLIFSVFLWVVGLLILYVVIETAVKNGINKSILGQQAEKRGGLIVNKKSFFENDLDKG
ncbi:hypothetical protein [Bacillus sp. FJAT-27445]|uniref:hypothetical protein n=1 Tax=Bacillus sp. FJAT-27445 TaxID=1679166 RepID=UPI000AD0277C|nr:hypothetical protein [Bacillus sp. FJAT-27445]